MKVRELRNAIFVLLATAFFLQFAIHSFQGVSQDELYRNAAHSCPVLSQDVRVWSAWQEKLKSRSRRITHCSLRRLGGHREDQYGGWQICESEQLLASKSAIDDKDRALIYSFGLGTDTSFDEDVIKKYGAVVHGFDPTPGSLSYVRTRARFLPDCYFALHPYGLNEKDGEIKLYPPENPQHISHNQVPRPGARPVAATLLSLATVMQMLAHRHIHILKMDVEGAEFAVLEKLLNLPPLGDYDEYYRGGLTDGWAVPSHAAAGELPFDQLCVEFHPTIHPGGKELGDLAMRRITEALSQRGFTLVHDTGSQELSFARLRIV